MGFILGDERLEVLVDGGIAGEGAASWGWSTLPG
jgi:hypothetical protein